VFGQLSAFLIDFRLLTNLPHLLKVFLKLLDRSVAFILRPFFKQSVFYFDVLFTNLNLRLELNKFFKLVLGGQLGDCRETLFCLFC